MQPEHDHYAILEITRTATEVEIRTAYRRLARAHHPDANPGPDAETLMRRLNEAWETLRDPQRRMAYDRTLVALMRTTVRPVRRPPPPRRPVERSQAGWFTTEDAPREATRNTAEFTGDPTIDYYGAIGVRADAPKQVILKALSRMAGELNGADISATEFTRKRAIMKEAWAILGDQYLRASYDRARKAAAGAPPPPPPFEGAPEPVGDAPPAGYRMGPVTVNGFLVDKGSQLGAVDLRGADLRGLDLAGTDLSGSRLQGADFEAASLRGARLAEADLSGANLRFADLGHADLSACVARQAVFSGAALQATNFFRAGLAGASFAGAVGPGVNFDYADLARCDFGGASITPQLIERGRLDGTIMPDGTVANEAGSG